MKNKLSLILIGVVITATFIPMVQAAKGIIYAESYQDWDGTRYIPTAVFSKRLPEWEKNIRISKVMCQVHTKDYVAHTYYFTVTEKTEWVKARFRGVYAEDVYSVSWGWAWSYKDQNSHLKENKEDE